jgi:hypothetical protein
MTVDIPPRPREFGETWTYESIVGALPGVRLTDAEAIVLQVAVFEVGLLVLAWVYDLWAAVPAGTVAVVVAGVGSLAMLHMGASVRSLDLPEPYGRVLFGSSIEVVLSVLAFAALVTHLLVVDPARGGTTLLERLFGRTLPAPAVYLALLVLWDLCYRIGTSWWVAVVSLWRSVRFSFDGGTAGALRRLDAVNVGFAVAQAALIPFLLGEPVLLAAVAGHIVAVTVVSAAAVATLRVG